MHPLKQLTDAVRVGTTARKESGKVTHVTTTTVHVMVNGFTRVITRTDATAYKAGDNVTVQGDVLTGRMLAGSNVPVYSV